MKRILINAAHLEEVRVALCDNNTLYDFDLENRTREQKKSNIYKGHVTRVEPSLESVFVEYGSERQGFLPVREIGAEFLREGKKGNIRELIKEGDEVIVQVEKEERGNKGAALSTFVSLAGRYLVLMPTNSSGGGISRQITGQTRDELKRLLSKLKLPKSMSVIIRTAGVGRSEEELQADLDQLLHTWKNIKTLCDSKKSPCLAYQEAGMVTRAVRDYLREDIAEVWIDHPAAFEEVYQFVEAVMPHQISKVKRYVGQAPIFSHFRVDTQIETAYAREVKLPSGGSIVIDQTEALVSIDINSAKATRGTDIESTATQTNLEAAVEIARQLRIRDMGGLVVIDFIDMSNEANQRKVEQRLKDSTSQDRARLQFASISRFGLMEMSRQRLRPSLEETTGLTCPRCHGTGMVRDIRSLSLTIMRDIEKIAIKEGRGEVQAEVPLEIGAFLLNEKRESLLTMEQDSGVRITVLPNANMETPHYDVRFKPGGYGPTSYERVSNRSAQESAELGYDTDWLDQPTQIPAIPSYNSTAKAKPAPSSASPAPSNAKVSSEPEPAAKNPAKAQAKSKTEIQSESVAQYSWLNKSLSKSWNKFKSVMLTPVIEDPSVTAKNSESSATNVKSKPAKTADDAPVKAVDQGEQKQASNNSDQASTGEKTAKRGNRRRGRRGDKKDQPNQQGVSQPNTAEKTDSGDQSSKNQSNADVAETSAALEDNAKAPLRDKNSRRPSRGPRNRNKGAEDSAQTSTQDRAAKSSNNSSADAPDLLKMQVIENPTQELKHELISLDLGFKSESSADAQGNSPDQTETKAPEADPNQQSNLQPTADSTKESHETAQVTEPQLEPKADTEAQSEAELNSQATEQPATADSEAPSNQSEVAPAQDQVSATSDESPAEAVSEKQPGAKADADPLTELRSEQQSLKSEASQEATDTADTAQPEAVAAATEVPADALPATEPDAQPAEAKSVNAVTAGPAESDTVIEATAESPSASKTDTAEISAESSEPAAETPAQTAPTGQRASNDVREQFVAFAELSEESWSVWKQQTAVIAQADKPAGSSPAPDPVAAPRASNDPRGALKAAEDATHTDSEHNQSGPQSI